MACNLMLSADIYESWPFRTAFFCSMRATGTECASFRQLGRIRHKTGNGFQTLGSVIHVGKRTKQTYSIRVGRTVEDVFQRAMPRSWVIMIMDMLYCFFKSRIMSRT